MSNTLLVVFIIYLIVINIAGFAVMGIDKKRAVKGQWRIPEKTFFIISLLGGGLGSWVGMYVFRHKTKHWYFVVFIPLIFIVETAAVIFLFAKGIL
ncbi:MAG: DUF1294 domain-containing protein [Parasporobacterium sp.]|nr:DUF1294 domain-containing protein [Parasporobacterium sp.]